jgi:16S rRNA (cytosine967-C5)-methyltransferase
MGENNREIVLDMLLTLERDEAYSHRLMKAVLDKYDYMDGRDKAFLKRLAEGTLERRLELDYYLNHYSKIPVKKMRPLIRCLLRMSVYQLIYMDSVPDSAVCNEACKLASKRGFGSLKGFVNGILRAISREKENLPLPDRYKEPVSYFSVKYSMPEWLVKLWMDEYGSDITSTLLGKLMEIHPVSLRFALKLSQEERAAICAKMEETGIKLRQSMYLPWVYLATQPGHMGSVDTLPGFEEGMCTVQDVSSALGVEAAGIREGDFVIDVCAAPGGKSILAREHAVGDGQRLPGEKERLGLVLARDVSEEKTALIEENIRRMGADHMKVEVFDATGTDEALVGTADVVLLDVPCSGLGVMGKKRDIKYRITRKDMDSLPKLQRQIARASAGYLKPGGILVYSTCTINSGENQEMVRFLTRELGLEPMPLSETLPDILMEQRKRLEADLDKAGKDSGFGLTKEERAACIQLLPGYMESDGFFIARFRSRQQGTDAQGEPKAFLN